MVAATRVGPQKGTYGKRARSRGRTHQRSATPLLSPAPGSPISTNQNEAVETREQRPEEEPSSASPDESALSKRSKHAMNQSTPSRVTLRESTPQRPTSSKGKEKAMSVTPKSNRRQPSRPVTPTPHGVSQDILQAFELASPGSAQRYPTRGYTGLSSRDSDDETESEWTNLLGSPSSTRVYGVASKMGRARKQRQYTMSPEIRQDENGKSQIRAAALQALAGDGEGALESELLSSPREARFNRTYGGEVRTFLGDQTRSSAASSSATKPSDFDTIDDTTSGQPPRESYADLRTRWVIEEGDTRDGLVPTAVQPPLRTLTTLRASGSLKRFEDELDYLLVGLTRESSLSTRRASALQIAHKLGALEHDEDDEEGGDSFLDKVSILDAQPKIYQALTESNTNEEADTILQIARLLSLCVMLQHRSKGGHLLSKHGYSLIKSLTDTVRTSRIVRTMSQTSRQRRLEKSQCEALFSIARSRDLVKASSSMAMPLVLATQALFIIVTLPSNGAFDPIATLVRSRSGGDAAAGSALQEIKGAIHHEAVKAETAIKLSVPSSTLAEDTIAVPPLDFCEAAGRLLEIVTGSLSSIQTGRPRQQICSNADVGSFGHDLVVILRYLVRAAAITSPESVTSHSTIMLAQKALSSWLKALIALTRTSATWCYALVGASGALEALVRACVVFGKAVLYGIPGRSDELISALKVPKTHFPNNSEGDANAFDIWCLTLALLTNLLEQAPCSIEKLSEVRLPLDEGPFETLGYEDFAGEVNGVEALHIIFLDTKQYVCEEEKRHQSLTKGAEVAFAAEASWDGPFGRANVNSAFAQNQADLSFVLGCLALVCSLSLVPDLVFLDKVVATLQAEGTRRRDQNLLAAGPAQDTDGGVQVPGKRCWTNVAVRSEVHEDSSTWHVLGTLLEVLGEFAQLNQVVKDRLPLHRAETDEKSARKGEESRVVQDEAEESQDVVLEMIEKLKVLQRMAKDAGKAPTAF